VILCYEKNSKVVIITFCKGLVTVRYEMLSEHVER